MDPNKIKPQCWNCTEYDVDLHDLNNFSDPSNDTEYNMSYGEIMRVNCVAAQWVDRYVTPFWYVVGIIGNTISACIWLQQRTRGGSSSAVYLLSLSISDTVTTLFN